LRKEVVDARNTSFEELIKFANEVLVKAIENTAFFSSYTLTSVSFIHLLNAFDAHYTEFLTTKTNEAKAKVIALLKLENIIHSVVTQGKSENISTFLELLEHLSAEEDLDLLVVLLYHKQEAWHTEVSPKYCDYISFLEPYLRLITGLEFNFNIIYHLTLKNKQPETVKKILKPLIQSVLNDLKAQKKTVEKNLHELETAELLTEVLALKNLFNTEASHKNAAYYHRLGNWSLLVQIIQLIVHGDHTAIRVILQACLYLGPKIKTLVGTQDNKPPTLYELENLSLPNDHLFAFGDMLADTLLNTKLDEKQGLNLLHTFGLTLLMFIIKKTFNYNYLVNNTNGASLLQKMFEVSQIAKKVGTKASSRYHPEGISLYEHLSYNIAGVVEVAYEKIPKHGLEFPFINDLLVEKLSTILNDNSVQSHLKYKLYQRLLNISYHETNYSSRVVQQLTFTTQPLKEIIANCQNTNVHDLRNNLKYNLNAVFKITYALSQKGHLFEDLSIESHLQAYIESVQNTKEKTPEWIELMKQLGIFFIKIFNLTSSPQKSKFFKALNEVIEVCQFSDPEFFCILPGYQKLLSEMANDKEVLLGKGIKNFVNLMEQKLIESQQPSIGFFDFPAEQLKDTEVSTHF
jgi:hypothetical protein